jgi:hypothetical protein
MASIRCTSSSSSELCATGQLGKNPLIIVWKTDTREIVANFQQERNIRAVNYLHF